MDRSYKRAIEVLNKSRRQRRPSIEWAQSPHDWKQMPNLNGKSDLKGTPSIFGMRKWLDILGHSSAEINGLNVMHVAGTKGKGSTCVFIESILRVHGRRTGFPRKTGLYTSPHLIYPEDRIRINFEPLPRDLFAKYFFEVHDMLSQHYAQDLPSTPRYLQLFTLLCFHTFIRENVDAAIFETHHGGEYDSTNIVDKPIVTAITSLGMDHVKQLGPSIENIAWHKAGIFKPGTPAFSVPQETAASEVLLSRAAEKGVSLRFISDDPSLPVDELNLSPDVQRTNCSLALAVVQSFLDQVAVQNDCHLDLSDIHQGIRQFFWPGRFQLVLENENQWFLDGAHNEMSVAKAGEWFLKTSGMQRTTSSPVRILIFSQTSDQREGLPVFERLATSLAGNGVQHVIFTTYERDREFTSGEIQRSKVSGLPLLQEYSAIWKWTQPCATVLFESTISGALEAARKIGKEYGSMQSLITGSLCLVGGALALLQPHVSGASNATIN